jgi:dihydrolipoyl dehydrogenase
MGEKKKYNVVVIGGGPGGYVAAIKASQNGKTVALVEGGKLGGTCLNVGCIPTKALLANSELLHKIRHAEDFGISVGEVNFDFGAMVDRKDRVVSGIVSSLEGLIRSNKVDIFKGHGRFTSPKEVKVLGEESVVLEGDSFIVATGSEPKVIPAFPFDFERVHSSTSMLEVRELPKKLAIIGGGYIGCEAASLYAAMGVEVVILEMLPTIVATEGKDVSAALTKAFERQGIEMRCNVTVEGVDRSDDGVSVRLKDELAVAADMCLVSVGRKFNSDDVGLEKAGVPVTEMGTIAVNERMETEVEGIYAIGDVTGKALLAHVASHQGMVAASNATGGDAVMHYNAVPSVIFTHPEVASVGMTLEKATEAGYDAVVGRFPFQALGRSVATMETEGFAQVVSEKKTGRILGAQVVGSGASSLIAEMALAITGELTVETVVDTIHAHPTISEGWLEASLMAEGTPLHLPPKRR